MNESLLLLRNFIKRPKEVGSITPSSKFLTREIVKNAGLRNAQIVVELGPGLGTFTKEILKRTDAQLICFEVNKKFCRHLEKNFSSKKLKIINCGAENINEQMLKIGIGKADSIISGLPFRNFSERKKDIILSQVKSSLRENGKFVLFQYTNGLIRLLEKHFSKVERKFVALNVPPAFVYVCE